MKIAYVSVTYASIINHYYNKWMLFFGRLLYGNE